MQICFSVNGKLSASNEDYILSLARSSMKLWRKRWVAVNKQGLVLCGRNPNPGLSYHLGVLQFEILGDRGGVISGTRKWEIMEHVKKWNKECHNNKAAKCKAVKISITIKEAKGENK